MTEASVSKKEYLKKYLAPPKGKKQKNEEKVFYINGEMPDNLDAFDERTTMELNMFKPSAATGDIDLPKTMVRRRTKGEISEEQARAQAEKARKKAELEAKYALWNRGLDTIKEHNAELIDARYEASKPLARYADDTDLNSKLKDTLHAEDPMSAYFAEKKRRKEEKEKAKKRKEKRKRKAEGEAEEDEEEVEERPRYKGPPEPPANRYGIWPGYRWDGVDRSNGFEKRLVDDITRRKVERELAYRWGAEDM